jgi:hypothetical protein
MLARAGASHLELDRDLLERVLPRVAEAAYRARYQHDDGVVLRDALGGRAS